MSHVAPLRGPLSRLVSVGVLGLLVLVASWALGAEPHDDGPAGLFGGGARPLDVGPIPDGLTGVDAPSCAPCHDDIIAEWRGSLHAAAWTDPVFQAAYTREPLAFCRNCHAPLHTSDPPAGVAAQDGVSCAACHVRDGAILAGPGDPSRVPDATPAPHPIRRVAALDDGGSCAPCHEFGFLAPAVGGRPRAETRELQQSTVSEWRAHRAATGSAASCQDCHMALTAGPRPHCDHRFVGGRDAAFIARALAIDLQAVATPAGVEVTARITPTAHAGHDVPTGDIFRRLELRVWPDGGDARAAARLAYERTYTTPPGGARHEVADTRVGEPGAELRTLSLPGIQAARLRWQLDHQLMPPPLARRYGVAPATNVRPIASGQIDVRQ